MTHFVYQNRNKDRNNPDSDLLEMVAPSQEAGDQPKQGVDSYGNSHTAKREIVGRGLWFMKHDNGALLGEECSVVSECSRRGSSVGI